MTASRVAVAGSVGEERTSTACGVLVAIAVFKRISPVSRVVVATTRSVFAVARPQCHNWLLK